MHFHWKHRKPLGFVLVHQCDPVLFLSLLQNLCFILPQFLYQFFCGYSQQVSTSPRPAVVQRRCEHEGGCVSCGHTSWSFSLWLPLPLPPQDVWAFSVVYAVNFRSQWCRVLPQCCIISLITALSWCRVSVVTSTMTKTFTVTCDQTASLK